MNPTNISVTVQNPTTAQWRVLATLLTEGGTERTDGDEHEASEETPVRARRGRPAKTVSPDEDEDFGTSEISAKDLREEAEEEEETDEDEDSEELDWATLKAAVNEYGEKNVDGMKAILASFNLKSTKELKNSENKWEPVYRKVMAKLKRK